MLFSQSRISVRDYGAKGNGIADDGPAIKAAIDYAMSFNQQKTPDVIFPAGVYRVTSPIIIGGYSLNPEYLFVSSPVYRYAYSSFYRSLEYAKGTRSAQLRIKGEGIVSIYGDFNDSTELKPIIAYQAAGDGRNLTSTLQSTGEISNIGIYAKGFFDANGKPQPRVVPPFRKNNQVGLLATYTNGLRVYNVSFHGLKEGMMVNNTAGDFQNLRFTYCVRGLHEIQSHCSSYKLITADLCDKGFEFRSNKLTVSNLYARFCKIGMVVGSSNNTFTSSYFENQLGGYSQILVGYNPGDPFYEPGLNGQTDCITFVDLTIATTDPSKPNEHDTGIIMRESARRVFISGGYLYTSEEIFTSPLNQIMFTGVSGLYVSENVFKIEADAVLRSLRITGLKAEPGKIMPLYVDDKGNIIK